MSKASGRRAAMRSGAKQSLQESYLEFSAKSSAAFARYPQMEPLRRWIFKQLLLGRRGDALTDHIKHWLRPFVRRARTRRVGRRADVLMWLESQRKEAVDTLVPVYRELVARDIAVELVSFQGPANLPAPSRVFEFPARTRVPEWVRGAWEGLCECEPALRDKALQRSFDHACAMLQGLYDELHGVIEASAPKVVLCASAQLIGGAAVLMASRLQGIGSLLLQHGMVGSNYTPLLADWMLIWGPSSEEILAALGLPRARLLTVGSPRHDSMRPSGNGRARATLLGALDLPDRPTFVFFSQGNDAESGDVAVECARWLEETAAHYANALNLVVRLHANEEGVLYRDCPHLTVISQAVELSVALDGCDWIGSISSTALYDGLLYGKQVWQFCADDWPVGADNWRQGLALRISSQSHMCDLVQQMLSQRAVGGVDRALVARAFANYGRATQAVADFVASHLRLSAGNPRTTAIEHGTARGA